MLRQNLKVLKRTIDPTNELIDSLQLDPLLKTVVDVKSLNSRTTPDEKIIYLLVSLNEQPQKVFEAFISLLNEHDQQHAAALLGGTQTSTRVYMSDEHYQTLCDKSFELRQFINPLGGLLCHLLSTGTFQMRDKERVQSKRTVDDMAEEVVNILCRKWDQAFDNFLEALDETGQPHVVYILTGQGTERPMRDDRLDFLKQNIVMLTENLTVTDSNLLKELIASKAFDNSDAQWIESEATSSHKAERLIAMLMRKPDSAFDKFIAALKDSGHSFVADELTEKTINGLIETEFSSVATEEQTETWYKVMRDSINEKNEVKTILKGNDILLAASKGSIRVHFTCLNVQAIETLMRLRDAGELTSLFARSFSRIYLQHGIKSCVICISPDEFERCKRHFSRSVLMKPSKRAALRYAAENLLAKIEVKENLLRCLTLDTRRKRAVAEEGENSRKAQKLLDIISRQPDSIFTEFIEALENTGQQEIAKLIKDVEGSAPRKESETGWKANDTCGVYWKAGQIVMPAYRQHPVMKLVRCLMRSKG
jgi:hypothetical protein